MISMVKRLWFVPVMLLYAAMVAFAVAYHEPWFDEAQSWLIARDCTFGELFTGALRYEGHPVLWYLILKVAIACHLPYEAVGVVSGLFAILGIWVLLTKSPFPKWFTVLLPFTFFLGYQYAVIARSYALLPLLLFAVASLAKHKWENPIWWSVLLLLTANLSIHSFVIASIIMGFHLVEVLQRWSTLDVAARKRQLIAAALYAIGAGGVMAMLWPGSDFGGATWLNGSFPMSFLWKFAVKAMDQAYFGEPALTVLFLTVSCYWFWKTRVLVQFVTIWVSLIAVFVVLRLNEHHHGILFLVWLFAFWQSLESAEVMRRSNSCDGSFRRAYVAVLVFAACLLGRQVIWTGYSMVNEVEQPYCGAAAAADFMKAHDLTKYRVAAVHDKVAAVLPYFDGNFFENFPNRNGKSFVEWRKSAYIQSIVFNSQGCLQNPCDVIVWSIETDRPDVPWHQEAFLKGIPKEWRCVGYFDGRQVIKDELPYHLGIAILMTQKLADKLGLPMAKCDSNCGAEQVTASSPKADRVEWAHTYLALGSILEKLDRKGSQQLYETVLEIPLPTIDEANPDLEAGHQAVGLLACRATAHSNLGTLLKDSDPKAALKHFEMAWRINPNSPGVCLNLAMALEKNNRLQDAIGVLQQSLRMDPFNPRARAMLQKFSGMLAVVKEGQKKETP
jgi:tetratricopeptide (TPR) repeat protein